MDKLKEAFRAYRLATESRKLEKARIGESKISPLVAFLEALFTDSSTQKYINDTIEHLPH